MMELSNLQVFLLAILVTAVVISITSQILGTIKTSEAITTTSVTNESINFVANDTYYSFGQFPVKGISAIYYFPNNSASFVLPAAHFAYTTGNSAQVKIIANGVGAYPNTTTGVKYVSYSVYNREYNITEKGQDAMKSVGDWLPTIGVVMSAAVVLGIINYFGR